MLSYQREEKAKMDNETGANSPPGFPLALKLFFKLYPESWRFRIYISRSLLLTPPVQTAGDSPTAAIALIDWRCVRCAAKATEVERVRIARLTRMLLVMLMVSSSEIMDIPLERRRF
jgi:hypothetical protein